MSDTVLAYRQKIFFDISADKVACSFLLTESIDIINVLTTIHFVIVEVLRTVFPSIITILYFLIIFFFFYQFRQYYFSQLSDCWPRE